MKKWKDEKIYVYLALIFGMIMVFLTPPCQGPDEDKHFLKSYQVSNGHFYSSIKNKSAGNYFPKEMYDYVREKTVYMNQLRMKYSYADMVMDQIKPMDYSKKEYVTNFTSRTFAFVYIAPALGMLISRILAFIFGYKMITPTYMLYFGRIFSLLFSVIITYFAIKKTPIFKKTFTVVALLPMVIFLNSVIGYDNVLISFSLLALSLILKWSFDEKSELSKKEFIILALVGIFLLNIKTLYFPVYLLLFLIPAKKFNGKKGKLKAAVIMISIIFGVTLLIKLPYILNPISSNDSFISKQISFIMNNPLKYISILAHNIWEQRYFQLTSMVGVFGLVDTYIPATVVLIIYLNIILIALSDISTDKYKVTEDMKIINLFYIIFAVIVIYTALYIYWTPLELGSIGTGSIKGVQGRYFIPLIIPFLMLLSNKKIKENKVLKLAKDNYVLTCGISLLISTVILLLRYWV